MGLTNPMKHPANIFGGIVYYAYNQVENVYEVYHLYRLKGETITRRKTVYLMGDAIPEREVIAKAQGYAKTHRAEYEEGRPTSYCLPECETE